MNWRKMSVTINSSHCHCARGCPWQKVLDFYCNIGNTFFANNKYHLQNKRDDDEIKFGKVPTYTSRNM